MKTTYFALSLLLVLSFGVSQAYADITIETARGSSSLGCENTHSGCYIPSHVTVDVGEKVMFSNTDAAAHTFTAGSLGDGLSGEFDTGLLMGGNAFEIRFDSEGTIPYFCMVHPWMEGTITVGSGNNPPQPPTWPPIPDPKPPCDCDDTVALQNEIKELKNEVRDLKLENKQLKNQVNSLKDQIVAMSGEFIDAITNLNDWFRSQLDN